MIHYIIRMVLTDKDIYNAIIKNIVLKPYSIKTLEKQVSAEFRQLKFDIEKNVIRNAIKEDVAYAQRIHEFQSVEYTYDLNKEDSDDFTFKRWDPVPKMTNPMLKALHEVQEYRITCKTVVDEKVKDVMADFWAVSDEVLKAQEVDYHPEIPTKSFNVLIGGLGLAAWQVIVLKEVGAAVLAAEWEKYTFYCGMLRLRSARCLATL